MSEPSERGWRPDDFHAFSPYEDIPIEALSKVLIEANDAEMRGDWRQLIVRWDSCDDRIVIRGERRETEQEARERIEGPARRKRMEAQHERQEYERLKAKFEGPKPPVPDPPPRAPWNRTTPK